MCRKWLCALLVLAGCVARAPADSVDVTVFGEGGPAAAGKSLHVLGGMTAGFAVAGVLQSTVDPELLRQYPLFLPAMALSAAVAAGIAKELLDATGFGDPRIADILITSAGGAAAAAMIGCAGLLYPRAGSASLQVGAYLFGAAALFAVPVAAGFVYEIRRSISRAKQARVDGPRSASAIAAGSDAPTLAKP